MAFVSASPGKRLILTAQIDQRLHQHKGVAACVPGFHHGAVVGIFPTIGAVIEILLRAIEQARNASERGQQDQRKIQLA